MLRTMMKSKIHRATVTQADLHYVGSVTVDEDLLEAADLLPGELVHIVDVTNGARLETYTIAGERGSGVLGINGAAARLVHPGDTVILIAYGQMDTAEAREFQPRVVFVDADNKILATGYDPAETFGDPRLTRGDTSCVRARATSLTHMLPWPTAGPPPGSRAGLDDDLRRRGRRLRHRRAHRGAPAQGPGRPGPRGHQGRPERRVDPVGPRRHRRGPRPRRHPRAARARHPGRRGGRLRRRRPCTCWSPTARRPSAS